jgi:hypothetical protein
LPFGSPRVDLSGFWFRPTDARNLGAKRPWKRNRLAGKACSSSRTCGGAVLVVNGEEAGWMADYVRNLEAAEEFDGRPSSRARMSIRIWFDDLAERDARYFFQLDYRLRPCREQALPIGGRWRTRGDGGSGARRRCISSMPAYEARKWRCVTDAPLPGN